VEKLKNVKEHVTFLYFATERHNKLLSTTSNLPLSPMYHVPFEQLPEKRNISDAVISGIAKGHCLMCGSTIDSTAWHLPLA
jgi:hypothetical protein